MFNQNLDFNPLFRLEARRIRWAQSNQHVRRVSIKWLWRTMLVLGVLWFLFVAPGIGSSYAWSMRTSNVTVLLLMLSIGADILLDMVCMAVTVNAINAEITSGRWDLVRLTMLPEEHIVAAKHAGGQLRAWRMMVVVFAMRLTVVALSILLFVVNFVRYPPSNYYYESTFQVIIVLGVFGAFYLIEPLWRMRALTALGMVVSSYTRSITSAALMAFGAIFLVWLSQGIVMVAIFWIMALFMRGIYSSFATFCIIFIACLGTGLVIFGYYRFLKNRCLKHVMSRLFVERA